VVRQTEAMQPAAYPPAPVISSEPLKPSGWWYGVAAGIAVAGIVIAIVVFVQTITGLIDRVDDFQRVTLPGSGTVTLEEGDYSIYHEFDGASSTEFGSTVPITLLAPDGTPVDLDRYDANVTYSWGDHEGVAAYSFTAEEAGTYTVSAETQSGVVAVGRGIGSGLVGGIVGAFLLGIGGSVIGGVIAIVVGIKRGRDRRSRMTYGPQFGPGPPGSGWAQGGWPQATQPAWSQPGVPGGPGGSPPGQYPPAQYPSPQAPQPPQPSGPYAPPQPPPGQGPPGPMEPPPGLPPT
jgi:hypothetical protein